MIRPEWLANNWFQLAEAVSIIAGLFFGVQSIRENTQTRRLSNLIAVTSNHRELWKFYLESENLQRVLQRWRDLMAIPIDGHEEQFIILVILHLKTVYETTKDGMAISHSGLENDIAEFLDFPGPRKVWDDLRLSFEPEFIQFVDRCIKR